MICFSPFSRNLHSITSPCKTPNSTHLLTTYLMNTFGFSESQALSASNLFGKRWQKKPQRIDVAVDLLRRFGFSDAHIQHTVRLTPQILFADVGKVIQPNLKFFEELGLKGSHLGLFISKNTSLLTYSLNRTLIPNIEILKRLLLDDHLALIHILRRCKWLIAKKPELRLHPNLVLLEKYGIVGSQLTMLLKLHPALFVKKESNLRDLVRKTENMGFASHSRMFVHGLYTLSSMTSETLQKKFHVFESFGFTHKECVAMTRKAPALPRCSVEKLKNGIAFFLNVVGFERAVLVHRPHLLMSSLEERVIPRYIVLEILNSKKLLKKKPSFVNVIQLPEDEFLDKFISKFRDNAEELLVAYKSGVMNIGSHCLNGNASKASHVLLQVGETLFSTFKAILKDPSDIGKEPPTKCYFLSDIVSLKFFVGFGLEKLGIFTI